MAAGLPIISSNAGGMEYFLQDGKNGFVVKSFDVKDYVSKIKLLMNDVELKRKIIDNNIHHSQKFSWDYVGKRITILMQESLSEKEN
jgi:glycosyltransferase involved in cell wall biosynthesis